MHIYIMRHGQSVANAQKVVSGSQESPLSELGRHQVRIQSEKLSHLEIDLIVCSPMRRALDTARLVADTLQYPHGSIKVLEGLRERALGDLEGESYASDEKDAGNTVYVESVNGVEPIEQFHSRVFAAFREITESRHHRNVLVISHMNVARMLEVVAKNLDAKDLYDMPRIDNAQVLRLI